MKACLLLVQAAAAFDFNFSPALKAVQAKTPLVYEGDGGDGHVDYIKYAINKALPSTVRGLALFHEKEPPVPTDLRFKHATIEDVVENFNNSLVSNCPIRKFNRGQCTVNSTYSDVHVIEDTLVDAVAVVLANNRQNKIVISYRATITTQNWLDDFNGGQIDLLGAPDGVKVHRGVFINYMATYSRVKAAVAEMLDDPRFTDYSVLVTGYSLGGAVATLALPTFVKMVQERPETRDIELISYAAPRMGNAEYAKYLASFDVPVTRFTNAYDIVSHLPIRRLGYTHAGVEIHTDQPNPVGRYTIRVCSDEYDEDPNCAWAETDEVNGLRHATPFGAAFPKSPFA